MLLHFSFLQLLLLQVKSLDLIRALGQVNFTFYTCAATFSHQHKSHFCLDFEHYNLQLPKYHHIRDLIVAGHNGLRDRAASFIDAVDMLKMQWSETLSEQAYLLQKFCQISVIQPCANNKTMASRNISQLQHNPVVFADPSDIAYNSIFLPLEEVNDNFIETALYTWYSDQTMLIRPKSTLYDNNTYFELIGDNNFTHMISPQTHTLGCSYAKYMEGLSLFCIYYPYIRSPNQTVYFLYDPVDHQCPYLFPLADEEFSRLCMYAQYAPSAGFRPNSFNWLALLLIAALLLFVQVMKTADQIFQLRFSLVQVGLQYTHYNPICGAKFSFAK